MKTDPLNDNWLRAFSDLFTLYVFIGVMIGWVIGYDHPLMFWLLTVPSVLVIALIFIAGAVIGVLTVGVCLDGLCGTTRRRR